MGIFPPSLRVRARAAARACRADFREAQSILRCAIASDHATAEIIRAFRALTLARARRARALSSLASEHGRGWIADELYGRGSALLSDLARRASEGLLRARLQGRALPVIDRARRAARIETRAHHKRRAFAREALTEWARAPRGALGASLRIHGTRKDEERAARARAAALARLARARGAIDRARALEARADGREE